MLLCLRHALFLAVVSAVRLPNDLVSVDASQPHECLPSADDPNGCLVVDAASIDASGDYEIDAHSGKNSSSRAKLEDGVQRTECEADQHERCLAWAAHGECDRTPSYMHRHCRKSCDSCRAFPIDSTSMEGIDNDECADDEGMEEKCQRWAERDECKNSFGGFMSKHCKRSCRMCPTQVFSAHGYQHGADLGVPQAAITPNITKALNEARTYLLDVAPKSTNPSVLDICRNKNESCARWAVMGECDANPKYMERNCAPMCKSCERMTIEGRCPIDSNAPKAWAPGDLDKLFTRLTSEPFRSEYDVQILSSPATDGPWIIQLDNILSEAEAKKLIDLGSQQGYERSTTIGKLNAEGEYEKNTIQSRTSTNAWCFGDCYNDEDAKTVMERLSNITQIPEVNSEYLQLLRYEPGQYYKAHNDYSQHHLRRQSGVRLLTLYMYLNDVEEGGGTNFDQLDVTVMPQRGRAVLWPSVLNDDPDRMDSRTSHQALPVVEGVKYGANAWFHSGDFKTTRANGCA